MKYYTFYLILVLPFWSYGQKSFIIEPDSTTIVGGNLVVKDGTEVRKGAFLRNVGLGKVSFDYGIDSVWVASDTLFVNKNGVRSYSLTSKGVVRNGLIRTNDTIELGGQLVRNTTLTYGGFDFRINHDSLNYVLFSPLAFLSKKTNGDKYTFIQQNTNSLTFTTFEKDTIQSVISMSDSNSIFRYGLSEFLLNKNELRYNAKKHNFLGNWLKIPQKNQAQVNELISMDALGGLVYNVSTKSINTFTGNQSIPVSNEILDGGEIQTITPTSWATSRGLDIPLLRIRHPLKVGNFTNSTSIDQDFKIIPYEYGMAVEYNGVFEQWVGEFSIHRGVNYYDVGDGGNGWGGVLWVGDDNDGGGLRMTARNNIPNGGNIRFTEISSELFSGNSAGDLRFRLVDSTDRINFIHGKRGSNNVYSYINKFGFKVPNVIESASVPSPESGLVVFDKIDSTLKYFTGNKWRDIGFNETVANDTITTNIVLSVSDGQIRYIDASNGDITITLPSVPLNKQGLIFKIFRLDNSNNSVVVRTATSDTINGAASKNISNQYDCMNVYAKGINVWIATKELGY